VESCQDADGSFDNFEDWVDHLREDARCTTNTLDSCPFCPASFGIKGSELSTVKTDEFALYTHIADHLDSIALISLSLISSYRESRSKRSDPSMNPARCHPHTPGRMNIPQNSEHLVGDQNEHSIFDRSIQIPLYLPRRCETGLIDRHCIKNEVAHQTMHIHDPSGSVQRGLVDASQRASATVSTFSQAWKPQDQVQNPETFDILVAEDNRINQRLLGLFLGKYQHTVIISNNGQEALDIFRKRSFNLVLMDISMPIMVNALTSQTIQNNLFHFRTVFRPQKGFVNMNNSTDWLGLQLLQCTRLVQ
jgi:hypothetical protein